MYCRVLPVSINHYVVHWWFASMLLVIFSHWGKIWRHIMHCPGRGTLTKGFLSSSWEMISDCSLCFYLVAKTRLLSQGFSVCTASVVWGLVLLCCSIFFFCFLLISLLYRSSIHLCLNGPCKREYNSAPTSWPRGKNLAKTVGASRKFLFILFIQKHFSH